MLTVELKQGKDMDKIWHKGMFRTSIGSSLVIMVVEDGYSGELNALILKDLTDKNDELKVDNSDVEFWLKTCPVIIEDAELILKGTVE